MSVSAGEKVFFNHPDHSWVLGFVKSAENGIHTCAGSVQGTTGEIVCSGLKGDDVHHFVEGSETIVDDLLQLPYLHDSTLLHQIRDRYFSQVMYTRIGAIMLSLNPFDSKIPRYQSKHMSRFFEGVERAGDTSDLGPTLWALAQDAYDMMRKDNAKQSILVSGESGAGKTEAVKIIVNYLTAASTKAQAGTLNVVAERIVQTSPILESFGNAKTLRNDNSSRFGKFMKLYFSPQHNYEVVGCFMESYLLEKSRVVHHGPGERGYHVFYQLVAGQHEQAARWRFSPKGYRKALQQGGEVNFVSPKDDTADFKEMVDSMDIVGMTPEEQIACFDVLATILHLQETVRFDEEQVENQDPMCVVKDTDSIDTLRFVCGELLQIDTEAFVKELTSITHRMAGEDVTKFYRKAQAEDIKDSICKYLYDTTFSWIVQKINNVTAPDPERYDMTTMPWIGLLDIFGFEQFQVNSLEQLCINLANEVIQSFYNDKVFIADKEECVAEGIDVTNMTYSDNAECVDLLTGKGGVFALLDEECTLPTGNDQAFLNKLVERRGKHMCFSKPRMEKNSFVISHFAGGVKYNVEGFREKNMDYVKPSFQSLFKNSPSPILSTINLESSKATTTKKFRTQLAQLLQMISTTHAHWVRCVKPHPNRRPQNFHGQEVMSQLRCSGVLDTVRIRKIGYAIRVPIPEFQRQFRIIKGLDLIPSYAPDAQIGKTKVFMRYNVFADLQSKKSQALVTYAVTTQAYLQHRQSNFVVACHRKVQHLNTIMAMMRGRLSCRTMREHEAEVKREVWLASARQLASTQNHESADRRDIEDEEAVVFEAIRMARKDSLAHIEKLWWASKAERDVEERAAVENEETEMRGYVLREYEWAVADMDRMIQDSYTEAFEAEARRIKRAQEAVYTVQIEEDEARRALEEQLSRDYHDYTVLMAQSAKTIRRRREMEVFREQERIRNYVDSVREYSHAILGLKEGEVGLHKAPMPDSRTGMVFSRGTPSHHNNNNTALSTPHQSMSPRPLSFGSGSALTRNTSPSPPRGSMQQPSYLTPTFSSMAQASNPQSLAKFSPRVSEFSPEYSAASPSLVEAAPSPSLHTPPPAYSTVISARSRTPPSSARRPAGVSQMSSASRRPQQVDTSGTLGAIASLQSIVRRAGRSKNGLR
eukprot:PhM_4_TR11899/c0_g1_i1/m.42733/K10357/MYO5; myosin V